MKKMFCLFSAVLVAFVTTNVSALEVVSADDTVNQTGKYDSTRLVAGNTVTNSAEVDGLSLIAGNQITTSGIAPYAAYAGNTISISDNISKDLFVAGNIVTIESSAKVGRDIYVVGSNVTVKSDVQRDLRAGGSVVDISGITIKGNAYIAAEQIVMDSETKIEGKLMYPEDAEVVGLDQADVSRVEATKVEKVVVEYNYVDMIKQFAISSVSSFITILAVFFMLPKSKEKLDKVSLTAGDIFKNLGIGFLVLITVPIVFFIGLITGILTPLALILLVVYIISIYVANLLVYYIAGNLICKNLIKNDNKYLAIAVGVLAVKLVKLIPVVGGIVGAFSLFYGLGLIFKYLSNRNIDTKTKKSKEDK